MKEIYRFTIDKEVEKSVTKETPEGQLTTKEKVVEPVLFVLKKPSRSEKDAADLFYSTWLSKYTIDYKLPTRAMLSKRYSETGGVLSDDDKQSIATAILEVYEKERLIQELELSKEKDQAAIEAAVKALGAARQELIDYQTFQNSLFSNTADSKADNKIIYWLALYLTYIEKDGKLEPFFKGDSFEEKLEQYDLLEESEDVFDQKAIDRIFSCMSTFYYNPRAKKEDFDIAPSTD